ncbi:MAG TPA: SRPBCC family protein [Stellaceae bacterium]|nr:SRPBCC family protein [Stellaceae bacterium]
MISLGEEVTIPAPPAEVWPLLRDPALVAACIPGATLTAAGEGEVYRGTIRVKFGPTVAVFRGEAKLSYDDAARTCTIEGRGIDGRGASRAIASGVVSASGGETTLLRVEGSFAVTGPLETFANAGGVHLARALLAEFAGNLGHIVEERGLGERADGEAPPTPVPSPAAAEAAPALPGIKLMWRALFGWLRQILFGKGQRGSQ